MSRQRAQEDLDLARIFREAGHPLRLDDILRLGRWPRFQKKQVLAQLDHLTSNGFLIRQKGGVWSLAANLKTIVGRLEVQRSGAAFVLPEKKHKTMQDIYIPANYLQDALHGDLVEVLLLPGRQGRSPEGRISRVLERANRELTVRVSGLGQRGQVYAVPADPRLRLEALVDVSGLDCAPALDELLVVRLEQVFGQDRYQPLWQATALRSLGHEDDISVQEQLTKLNHQIPQSFPERALEEANQAANHQLLSNQPRRDLTELPLLTIDGPDARDFDDAIYVCPQGRGWRLVVAIADVSAFVKPNGALDREARERGNSYYFPASVEPMLPEVLSNGLCSLRPDEERLCLVADLELDQTGEQTQTRFYPAVMRSRARLTYEFVQEVLDNGPANQQLAPDLAAMLHDAGRLAAILRLRRSKRGSLNFDMPEADMLIADNRVVSYHNRQVLFSHHLIEALMVAANEAVAVFLREQHAPGLFRVHPAPDLDKLKALAKSLRSLGIAGHLPAKVTDASWLPALLAAAKGTDQEDLINNLVLRAMMQARYDPEPSGHFGLASDCYCHFTSPIRRYADLVTHRALRYALGLDPGGAIPAGHKLLAVAQTCNERERLAQAAEREITRRMGCLYLRDKIGKHCKGVISGVMQFGLFVSLDNLPVEGMLRLEELGRDFFEYDLERQEIFGRKTGQVYRLGQSLDVVIQSVSVGRLEIDLALAKSPSARRKTAERPRPNNSKRRYRPS